MDGIVCRGCPPISQHDLTSRQVKSPLCLEPRPLHSCPSRMPRAPQRSSEGDLRCCSSLGVLICQRHIQQLPSTILLPHPANHSTVFRSAIPEREARTTSSALGCFESHVRWLKLLRIWPSREKGHPKPRLDSVLVCLGPLESLECSEEQFPSLPSIACSCNWVGSCMP